MRFATDVSPPRAQWITWCPSKADVGSDYTLVGGVNLQTPYHGHPVSPTFSPPNGTRQTGFMGDYSGITLVGSTAHPIWDDPRNNVAPALRDPDQPVLNDQDVYTTATGVPGL